MIISTRAEQVSDKRGRENRALVGLNWKCTQVAEGTALEMRQAGSNRCGGSTPPTSGCMNEQFDSRTCVMKQQEANTIMLRSLIKGVGMGAGMGIGQEISGAVIQHIRDRRAGQGPAMGGGQQQDIRCGGCGEINTGDSRFCGACGNALVARCNLSSGVRCNCGFINANGQKFCSECGTRLV